MLAFHVVDHCFLYAGGWGVCESSRQDHIPIPYASVSIRRNCQVFRGICRQTIDSVAYGDSCL